MGEMLLTNARSPHGPVGSVAVRDGVVVDVAGPDAEVVDLDGRLLLPAMAEPHAHLDKAYLADDFPNPTGDLYTAIEVMHAGWHRIDQADIEARSELAARRLLLAGTTAIRTHADVAVESGLKSVEALTAVRDRLAHLIDIQVVSLAGPLTGPEGAEGRALLAKAIVSGIDLVGSCPHVEDDPLECIDHTLDAAVDSGLRADFHFDEVLDVQVQHLMELAHRVERRGLGGRVTASHCVSHGLLDHFHQRDVARALADTGISVITNPRTNLFLQARGIEQAPPRGMVGIQAMLDEGVDIAAGADNVQDPFYIVGRSDPLETASLLVAAAHRTVAEAWSMVSGSARRVIGASPVGTGVGMRADLVAIRAGSLREAVAEQSADRIVFRDGVVVARSTVTEWMAD